MSNNNNNKPIIPVTILTGFLGSGKTTLLNHILKDKSHGMKFAVIENEFGDIGIDEHVLVPQEHVNEEIIEVVNGCICCTVRGDLVKALHKLYDRVSEFDGVLIETTGLADPAPVCQTFFVQDNYDDDDDDEPKQQPSIKDRYRLDAVITVVDANNILERLAEEKPVGVENEAVEQVAFADKILLNKVDLITQDERLNKIETKLKELNPQASIQRTTHCSTITPKDLLNIQAFDLERVLDFDPQFLLSEDGGEDHHHHHHEHDQTVKSISMQVEGDVNILMLQGWIQQLIEIDGANLYRYKGIISVKNMSCKFVFQGVGMMFDGGFLEDAPWKENEKRESRFVFIGKNLKESMYREGFMTCRI